MNKGITEDYVSYEIAKLLKEKGFNEEVRTFYNSNGKFEDCSFPLNHNLDIGSGFVSAPSQSLALKWLREVHKIFIDICIGDYDNKLWYDYDIIPINGKKINCKNYKEVPFSEYDYYEQAVEAALKYTLENLV